MTRALPGKRPLLVPARLRNPQHFHRLCTGLAPLRTSHPHVCAQVAGKQSCCRLAGSSGSGTAPVIVCRPARRVREAGTRWSHPPMPGKDRCPPLPGSRRPQVGAKSRVRPRLVGTDMIKVLANRKPVPAADGCRILCNLSVAAGILVTHTVDICAMRANSQSQAFEAKLARLMWQAGKRCYRRRPRRR
jgi:hypothetical protein